MHSPFKVSFRALAGAGRHWHRVCFPHHTSGCGFQFPVDSFHSHEAWLTLRAQFQERTERDREQSGTHSSLATIHNLAAATSRVWRVRLRLGGSDAWLELFVFLLLSEYLQVGAVSYTELLRCQLSERWMPYFWGVFVWDIWAYD